MHARGGWNVGRPPYGYVAEKIPHPVPARRAEGRTKSKLTADPVRAAAVTQMFTWRTVATPRLWRDCRAPQLGPRPIPATGVTRPCAVQRPLGGLVGPRHPSQSQVHGLHGVEPSGHQEGRQGQPARGLGVVEEPTHEAIVTRDIFETAIGMTEVRKRSRNGSGPNVKHTPTPSAPILSGLSSSAHYVVAGCSERPIEPGLPITSVSRASTGEQTQRVSSGTTPRPYG